MAQLPTPGEKLAWWVSQAMSSSTVPQPQRPSTKEKIIQSYQAFKIVVNKKREKNRILNKCLSRCFLDKPCLLTHYHIPFKYNLYFINKVYWCWRRKCEILSKEYSMTQQKYPIFPVTVIEYSQMKVTYEIPLISFGNP